MSKNFFSHSSRHLEIMYRHISFFFKPTPHFKLYLTISAESQAAEMTDEELILAAERMEEDVTKSKCQYKMIKTYALHEKGSIVIIFQRLNNINITDI